MGRMGRTGNGHDKKQADELARGIPFSGGVYIRTETRQEGRPVMKDSLGFFPGAPKGSNCPH